MFYISMDLEKVPNVVRVLAPQSTLFLLISIYSCAHLLTLFNN